MLQNIVERVQNNKLFIEAHIADLHFGAFNPEEQYKILKEQFLAVIQGMGILDIVSINGDIFDHKFMANSDAVMYACYFIDDLVQICAQKNATLLIVGGTFKHDADQLKLFYKYVQSYQNVDARIVEEVRFEYVKGKKILIIPELYGKGKEYYSKYLFDSGIYDAVYMHGALERCIYGLDKEDLDSVREPVFSMDDFINCAGPIISGHVHTPGCHEVYFYYCGCPYRWEFGQEEEKGFIILLHNTVTREHAVHFQPIKSFRYDTINLDDMIEGDPQVIIEYIDKLQKNGIDHIRIQLTKNSEDNLSVLKTFYRTNSNVKIDVNFKNEEVVKNIKKLDEKYKNYEYLKSASEPECKLVQYMDQCEGSAFITVDELKEILRNI